MGKGENTRMVVVSDDYADEDGIGYREHGEGLIEMIRCVESSGSFTIGVHGQWGQGKTSLLRQIKKALDKEPENGKSPIFTVWFNPWQFTGEEHLIIPFFHTLIASLEKYEKKIREKSAFPTLVNRVSTFLKKLSRVPVALAYGMEGEIKVPLLLKAKFSFHRMIKESRNQEEKIAQEERANYLEAVQQYESLYYNLIQELQEAATMLNTKVVVFIDDLDRCLPEKAIELLEGLKVLLDMRGFVFVIGVAREVIERGIRVRYQELYREKLEDMPFLEQDYLDKIIQFSIALPPADPDLLRENIVEAHMKELKAATPYINTILSSLGNNPRTLKRFVNNVSFLLWVADRKRKQVEHAETFLPELLIKISLIAFQFPRLYRQLCDYPHHLTRLQKVLEKLEEKGTKGEEPEEKFGKLAKTGLAEIDRWLEQPDVSKLAAILRCESRLLDGKESIDKGFKDRQEVERYVCMLASIISSESEKQDTGGASDQSLREIMESRMVRITGGVFRMGDEKTGRHEVTVNDFWIDKYPVTQSLYHKVSGKNPSRFTGDDKPVENVTWLDAVRFCNKLSGSMGLDPAYTIEQEKVERKGGAPGFRLSTEAEWEYACRAGTKGERYGKIDDIAWYVENSGRSTQGVGQKEPNHYGLYDMLGNVWEWVEDDWHANYNDAPTDGRAWIDDPRGSIRVIRGGSWYVVAQDCWSAIRYGFSPGYRFYDLGFRLSRSLP
jgi:formylglycine-generating enzyme required for sulfatase activity